MAFPTKDDVGADLGKNLGKKLTTELFKPALTRDFDKCLTHPVNYNHHWAQWETLDSQVQQVAEKFVFANCYNQQAAGVMLSQCQVSES